MRQNNKERTRVRFQRSRGRRAVLRQRGSGQAASGVRRSRKYRQCVPRQQIVRARRSASGPLRAAARPPPAGLDPDRRSPEFAEIGERRRSVALGPPTDEGPRDMYTARAVVLEFVGDSSYGRAKLPAIKTEEGRCPGR